MENNTLTSIDGATALKLNEEYEINEQKENSTINNFAEIMFKDNFQNPEKWKYISDNVMGGISTGEVHTKKMLQL